MATVDPRRPIRTRRPSGRARASGPARGTSWRRWPSPFAERGTRQQSRQRATWQGQQGRDDEPDAHRVERTACALRVDWDRVRPIAWRVSRTLHTPDELARRGSALDALDARVLTSVSLLWSLRRRHTFALMKNGSQPSGKGSSSLSAYWWFCDGHQTGSESWQSAPDSSRRRDRP